MGDTVYDRENTTRINLKLNNKTDADIIQHLESIPNKQGYIKNLIREDMKGDSTMNYHIKEEYLSLWGEETTTETIITQDELERLAAEWEKPVEELLKQLEPIK